MKFHGGSSFSADDVVWNYGRMTDNKTPQFFPQQFALNRGYMTNVANMEKLDDHTVAITTKFVESLFPYTMSYVPMISRCRAEALLSGQVNFMEAPPPDSIPRLKATGMNIVTNVYPHDRPFTLNFHKGPFTDVRVRQAANYALNRGDFVELLGGLATEEYAQVPPNMPYYGKPRRYEFDPTKARALLKEAGCLPCNINLAISTSGSGQMQPLPMNELLKTQLEEVGFKVNFLVMDWNAMLEIFRSGVEKCTDMHGVNGSRAMLDPVVSIIKPVAKAFLVAGPAATGAFLPRGHRGPGAADPERVRSHDRPHRRGRVGGRYPAVPGALPRDRPGPAAPRPAARRSARACPTMPFPRVTRR